MKKFGLFILLVISMCFLTACKSCNNSQNSVTVYECTEWRISEGTSAIDILKGEDDGKTFEYYRLYFYTNGSFRLVFKLADGTIERKTGTYVRKVVKGDNEEEITQLHLTYYSYPEERQDLFGAVIYTVSDDSNTLSRRQSQQWPNGGPQTIVRQVFEKIKA